MAKKGTKLRRQIEGIVETMVQEESNFNRPLQQGFKPKLAKWDEQEGGRQPYAEPKQAQGSHNPRTGAMPPNNPKGGEKGQGQARRGKEEKGSKISAPTKGGTTGKTGTEKKATPTN